VAHVRQTPSLDQVDDQMHLVASTEVRHLRLRSRRRRGFSKPLMISRVRPPQSPTRTCIAEQVGLVSSAKGCVSMRPARVPRSVGVGERWPCAPRGVLVDAMRAGVPIPSV